MSRSPSARIRRYSGLTVAIWGKALPATMPSRMRLLPGTGRRASAYAASTPSASATTRGDEGHAQAIAEGARDQALLDHRAVVLPRDPARQQRRQRQQLRLGLERGQHLPEERDGVARQEQEHAARAPSRSAGRGRPPHAVEPLAAASARRVAPGHQHHQREDDHAHGRAEAELQRLEQAPVGVDGERLRGARGPAAGQDEHEVEGPQRVERAEERGDHQDAPQQRQRDQPEDRRPPGAVHLRGLVDLARECRGGAHSRAARRRAWSATRRRGSAPGSASAGSPSQLIWRPPRRKFTRPAAG